MTIIDYPTQSPFHKKTLLVSKIGFNSVPKMVSMPPQLMIMNLQILFGQGFSFLFSFPSSVINLACASINFLRVKKRNIRPWLISAHADGGPRSPTAHAGPFARHPHQHERKFSGAHVCRVTFKRLPQPLRSHI